MVRRIRKAPPFSGQVTPEEEPKKKKLGRRGLYRRDILQQGLAAPEMDAPAGGAKMNAAAEYLQRKRGGELTGLEPEDKRRRLMLLNAIRENEIRPRRAPVTPGYAAARTQLHETETPLAELERFYGGPAAGQEAAQAEQEMFKAERQPIEAEQEDVRFGQETEKSDWDMEMAEIEADVNARKESVQARMDEIGVELQKRTAAGTLTDQQQAYAQAVGEQISQLDAQAQTFLADGDIESFEAIEDEKDSHFDRLTEVIFGGQLPQAKAEPTEKPSPRMDFRKRMFSRRMTGAESDMVLQDTGLARITGLSVQENGNVAYTPGADDILTLLEEQAWNGPSKALTASMRQFVSALESAQDSPQFEKIRGWIKNSTPFYERIDKWKNFSKVGEFGQLLQRLLAMLEGTSAKTPEEQIGEGRGAPAMPPTTQGWPTGRGK